MSNIDLDGEVESPQKIELIGWGEGAEGFRQHVRSAIDFDKPFPSTGNLYMDTSGILFIFIDGQVVMVGTQSDEEGNYPPQDPIVEEFNRILEEEVRFLLYARLLRALEKRGSLLGWAGRLEEALFFDL